MILTLVFEVFATSKQEESKDEPRTTDPRPCEPPTRVSQVQERHIPRMEPLINKFKSTKRRQSGIIRGSKPRNLFLRMGKSSQ